MQTTANRKRYLLIVDDEEINRSILGLILQEDFELFFAKDGEEALELIRLHQKTLSMILLDLIMPKISGMELLQTVKSDPALAEIPVIVSTSDKSAEVQCLKLGAADFITKPYDTPEVIKARIQRVIELREDRETIRTTEFDSLTGLYSKRFFFRYADQYDLFHPDRKTDAVFLNISHFHLANGLYGRAFGDEVLRRIAEVLKETVKEWGGLACRRESDQFLLYCPSGHNYSTLLSKMDNSISSINKTRLIFKMGIYPECDRGVDLEERFYRAKLAIESGDTKSHSYAIYNDKMHEKELFERQLLNEIDRAIEEKQFLVYFQPKYYILGETPKLSSAEALIRWNHPQFGMISPGQFIPLFEKNGLTQKLDRYVWAESARQIAAWKERGFPTVPISVNVSRMDLFDPNLVEFIHGLIEKNSLSESDLLLEITESAYAEDSEEIINVVNRFRALGFRIEMDDFGAGYSSLNMLSSLPIDALKLDMEFIRNITANEKNVLMLRLMVNLARELSIPVIAEGVETEEQLGILKELGCDIVQGYYFSRPVPGTEFESFLKGNERC